MSYLQDSQKRKKKFYSGSIVGICLVIVFLLRGPIYTGGSAVFHSIGGGVWRAGNSVGGFFGGIGSWFHTKNTLSTKNNELVAQNESLQRELLDRNILLNENTKLKEMLGRKSPESKLILGVVLVKPNRSPYDTLVLDVGESSGIKIGQKVFADGVSIGEVYETSEASSKMKLYSTPGEKTDVVIAGSDVYMQAVGRGGGNFEITVPSGITVPQGVEVYIPGLVPTVLGIADAPISQSNDPFQKVLVRSTINFNQLKWVEVKIN